MTKKLLMLFIALGCCSVLRAQPELTKTAVASGGGNFANGGLSLSSTVAELTMVTTFNAGTSDLFQGFQNSARLIEWVNVNPVAHNELTVLLYPNPASAFLNLEMADRENGKLMIALNDMLGRTLRFVAVSEMQSKVQLDVSDLPSGMYSLSVFDHSSQNVFNQSVNVIH